MGPDAAADPPDGAELILEPPLPPAVVYRGGQWAILVDVSDRARGGASSPDLASSVLRLNTGEPRGGSLLPALQREPAPLRLGASWWHGWDLAHGDGPLVQVLCVGDPASQCVAVHLPGPRMLILGDAAIVPHSTERAVVVERVLTAALGALDAEGVERVCGSDARLRDGPFGDEARARLLSVLADVRRAGYGTDGVFR